jgi:hypothetical protein
MRLTHLARGRCRLLALFGPDGLGGRCLLLRAKPTSRSRARISQFDPKETPTPRFDRPLRLARDQDGSVFRAQPRFDALDQPLPQ